MHGAYPNKLLKKRKIAGINLIPYIKIQIRIYIVFIPILRNQQPRRKRRGMLFS